MKFLSSLLIFLLFSACGPKPIKPREVSPMEALDSRVSFYLSHYSELTEEHGFIDSKHCDSLTYSALAAASGAPVEVEASELSPGKWIRRPVSLPPCWENGQDHGAPSTISRDGILSVLWWAWTKNKQTELDALWKYASEHAGKMGEGRLAGADTLLNPNMWALLARLAPSSSPVSKQLRPSFGPGATGYQRQLQVLQIVLWAEVTGELTPDGVERLVENALEQPWNPLFSAAATRWAGIPFSEASIEKWPSNRMPNSQDWCSEFVTMEDAGASGFMPCPEETHTYTGVELMLTSRILKGK